jgi:hypothetical protein
MRIVKNRAITKFKNQFPISTLVIKQRRNFILNYLKIQNKTLFKLLFVGFKYIQFNYLPIKYSHEFAYRLNHFNI